MILTDDVVELSARAVRDVLGAQHDHIPAQIHSERIARAALEAARYGELQQRVRELEAEIERVRPRYAQPCFNHEYITPGCSECGNMA